MECILAIYTHMQHTEPCAYACAHTHCFYHMMSFVLRVITMKNVTLSEKLFIIFLYAVSSVSGLRYFVVCLLLSSR